VYGEASGGLQSMGWTSGLTEIWFGQAENRTLRKRTQPWPALDVSALHLEHPVDECPRVSSSEFELYGDVDLTLSFLFSMILDERPTLDLNGPVAPAIATYTDTRSREPTEDEWENT